MAEKKPIRHIDIALDVINTHRANVVKRKMQLDAADILAFEATAIYIVGTYGHRSRARKGDDDDR
jgi:hypothetical protein